MTILTPTKFTGAQAAPTPLHYVDPAGRTDDDLLREQLGAVNGVDPVFLAHALSAFLTHERCGVHLYRAAGTRAMNPMLRSQFERFGTETERHVEILEDL